MYKMFIIIVIFDNTPLNFFKYLLKSNLCNAGHLSQFFDNKNFASLRLCV
jgi:hypothetical protein